MAESAQERTEKPTGKRRGKFRRKGQVAQSKQVNTFLLLSASVLFWHFYAPVFLNNSIALLRSLLTRFSEVTLTPDLLQGFAAYIFLEIFKLIAPIMFLCMTVGIIASLLQVGWLFTTKTFEPDFKKFNPITGMKKFFTIRPVFTAAQSIVKTIIVAWIIYSTIVGKLDDAVRLMDNDVYALLSFFMQLMGLIITRCLFLLFFIAIIDYAFNRWRLEKKMKMTRQEIKEERKDSEGDPKIKGKIRQLQYKMAKQRMMAEVPKADVVITNPTHISVALVYDRDQMAAPRIIAAGEGFIALRIREIAKENKIPLVENPPLARMLYKLEVGSFIPENLYKAVAEVLAYIYSLKRKRKHL